MKSAWDEDILPLQSSMPVPRLQGLLRNLSDLELDWAPHLVLHNDDARGGLISITRIPHLQGDALTVALFAVDVQVEQC
jgi:hypothetical protein